VVLGKGRERAYQVAKDTIKQTGHAYALKAGRLERSSSVRMSKRRRAGEGEVQGIPGVVEPLGRTARRRRGRNGNLKSESLAEN